MYSYKKISMYSYKKVSLLLRRLYWLVEPSHRFFEWKQEICLLKSVIENEKNTHWDHVKATNAVLTCIFLLLVYSEYFQKIVYTQKVMYMHQVHAPAYIIFILYSYFVNH